MYGVAASVHLVSDLTCAVAVTPYTRAFAPQPSLRQVSREFAAAGAWVQLFYPLTCDDAYSTAAAFKEVESLCLEGGVVGLLNMVLLILAPAVFTAT